MLVLKKRANKYKNTVFIHRQLKMLLQVAIKICYKTYLLTFPYILEIFSKKYLHKIKNIFKFVRYFVNFALYTLKNIVIYYLYFTNFKLIINKNMCV